MKHLQKLFLLNVFVICMISIASAQNKKQLFDEKTLTKQQLADLKAFRDLKGKDRWDAFQKIRTLIPQAEITEIAGNKINIDTDTMGVIMTKQQFIKLFGEPAEDRKSILDYDLDQVHRVCILNIFLEDEKQVGGYAFSNCDKYVPIMK